LNGTKFGSLNLYSQWIHFGSKINLYTIRSTQLKQNFLATIWMSFCISLH